MVCFGNGESLQEIGIDRVTGMRPGETRLPVEGLDAHCPHEGSCMDSAYGIASQSEYVSHAPGAEVGFFEVNLIDYAHEFLVVIADRGIRIVEA